MIYNFLEKQEPNFILTKSLTKYPNIKAQTSNEIQQMENFENSNVVFDDMSLSKNKQAISTCFLQEGDTVKLIFTIYLEALFISLKILFVRILIQLICLNKL